MFHQEGSIHWCFREGTRGACPAWDNTKKESKCSAVARHQRWNTYEKFLSQSLLSGGFFLKFPSAVNLISSPSTKSSVMAGKYKTFSLQTVSWSSQISGEHLPTFETAFQQSQMLQEHLFYVKKLFHMWALIYTTAYIQTFSMHCVGLLFLFV